MKQGKPYDARVSKELLDTRDMLNILELSLINISIKTLELMTVHIGLPFIL